MCVCIRARTCSHPHLLVCGRGAQTGSSSIETNNHRRQNTMRTRHSEAPRVTNVPCALHSHRGDCVTKKRQCCRPLSITRQSPTQQERRIFREVTPLLSPHRIHTPCFFCQKTSRMSQQEAWSLVTQPLEKCGSKEVKDKKAVHVHARQTSFSSQPHISLLISRETS